jgi:hypothetical protein
VVTKKKAEDIMTEQTNASGGTAEVANPGKLGKDLYHFLHTLNFLERFLLFMSKTEMNILQYCTRATRMTLTSVGGMVVITGILAFFSAYFTIQTCFFKDDVTWMHQTIPIVVASIYSVAIMAFDREIVSSTTIWAGVIRIPFACLIGVVIAFPMELQLQQGRISAELDKMVAERNQDKYSKISALEGTKNQLLTQSIAPLENKKKSLEKLRDQELQSAEWEQQPEHGLCRGRCEEHKANAQKYQQEIDQVREQIMQEQQRISSGTEATEAIKSIAAIQRQIKEERSNSNDLLSQKVALDAIHKNPVYGGSASTLGAFLMLFFISFELFPVLIKMTMPYTEYHAYLDARMRLNVAKITAISNYWWKGAQNRPEILMSHKTEVTDMFAEVLEDRERDLNHPDDAETAPHV